MMNVLKHAGVPTAKLSLRRSDEHQEFELQDQGRGFDPSAPVERRSSDGFGLLSVREQIARLGGTLEVDASAGRGTRARVRVPLQPPSDGAP